MYNELRHDELIRLELQVIADRATWSDWRHHDRDHSGRRRRRGRR